MALLWGVHASKAFQDDARQALGAQPGESSLVADDAVDACMAVMHIVGGELDAGTELESTNRLANLESLETTALRGAILLLETAWFAKSVREKIKADRKQRHAEAAEQAKLAEKQGKLFE